MRDTHRISPLCIEIAIQWMNTCPDMRFLQLIDNFQAWIGSDGYYMEDDIFLEKFKKFMRTLSA